jgi:hypothetical protein
VIRRGLAWILPSESGGGVIYGVILVGALLAAEDGIKETYLDTVLSAAIAIAIYWLAHAYTTVLGRRLSSEERLTVSSLGRGLAKDAALLRGAAIPLLVLLICWVSGVRQASGVDAALWSAVASLIGFELLAALRAPGTLAERALELAVGATIGLGVFLLKVVLH